MAANADIEHWNKRFSGEDYRFGTAPNVFLAAQKHRLRPGMTALSVSDGEGRNSVWLAQQGLRVSAFDFSPVGVKKARALAERSGVSVDYMLCDINEYDWDAAQYDCIAAIFFQFLAPAERQRVFHGFMRALAPGGLLFIQGYTPKQREYKTGGPSQIENLYTTKLLRESFVALEILHLAEHEDEVDEGAGHSGMSALIDLVARRPLNTTPNTKPSTN